MVLFAVVAGAAAAAAFPVSANFNFSISNSLTNQLMAHHNPPLIHDRAKKWMLPVATSSSRSITCRAAKETLVAATSDGVAPGVKMDSISDVTKVATIVITSVGTQMCDPRLKVVLQRMSAKPLCDLEFSWKKGREI